MRRLRENQIIGICCLMLISPVLFSEVITLQPGPVAGKDAEVWNMPAWAGYAQTSGLNKYVNEGEKYYIRAACWTYDGQMATHRAFIQFDLNEVPAGKALISAKLHLYSNVSNNQTQSGENAFNIFRVTEPWDEMNIIWDNQPDYISTVAGRDFTAVPASTSSDQDYVVDLTGMVAFWLENPGQNYGMALKLATESTLTRVFFNSSDYEIASRRPKLVITLADDPPPSGGGTHEWETGPTDGVWEETLLDDFETDFGWPVWDRYAASGGYTWDRTTEHVTSGNYGIWCARNNLTGYPKLTPGTDNYPANMAGWAIYRRTLDLRNCADAELVLDTWYKVSDTDKFKVLANKGDGAWAGFSFSGSSNSLEEKHLSFSNWNGQDWLGSIVTIAFVFESNASGTNKGAFIDNLRFRKLITGRPDIVIDELDFSPSHQPPGGLITVESLIENTGTFKNSITSQYNFYLSADPFYSPEDDILIGYLPTLKYYIGQKDSLNRNCMLPKDLSYGEYYVGVYFDPDTTIIELDRDNNWALAPEKLTVGNESTDWEVIFSEDFEEPVSTPTWRTHMLTGSYGWDQAYAEPYLGTGSAWCAMKRRNASVPLLDPEIDELPVGEYVRSWFMHEPAVPFFEEEDIQVLVSARIFSGGFYVDADPGNWEHHGEFIEGKTNGWIDLYYNFSDWPDHGDLRGHNVYCGVYYGNTNGGQGAYIDNFVIRKKIGPLPDLVVEAISPVPSSVRQGDLLLIDAQVRNIGQAASAASAVQFYLSADAVFQADTDSLLGVRSLIPLSAGSSASAVLSIPSTQTIPAGSWHIVSVLDPANTVTERLESNNMTVQTETFTVLRPPRDVHILSGPAGVTLMLDGSPVTTPSTIEWEEGSEHTISADTLIPVNQTRRLRFDRWNDGGGSAHTVSVTGALDTLQVFYGNEFLLTLKSPLGTLSGAGWYPEGVLAHFETDSVIVMEGTRHLFKQWTGDYNASGHWGSVIMEVPKTLTAEWSTQHLLQADVQDNSGGTVLPADPVWINAGDSAQVTAVPDHATGYTFKSWTGDTTSTNNPLYIVMNGPVSVTAVFEIPSAIDAAELPAEFALKQNYPNPFNPETLIAYDVPEAAVVHIEVFDLMGRKVRMLVGETRQPGAYQVIWNGRNDAGQTVGSGTYMVMMHSGDYQKRIKAVFLK